MTLQTAMDLIAARKTIDQFCKQQTTCYTCPLRTRRSNGTCCSVARSKWRDSVKIEKNVKYGSWADKKKLLVDLGWSPATVGNNKVWYKGKAIIKEKILRDTEDITEIIGGDNHV